MCVCYHICGEIKLRVIMIRLCDKILSRMCFDIPLLCFTYNVYLHSSKASHLFDEYAMTLLGRFLSVAWIIILGVTTSWAQGLYKLSDIAYCTVLLLL